MMKDKVQNIKEKLKKRQKDPKFMDKIREKLKKLKNDDPNIYPLA